MSILSANKKYLSLARQQVALAENEQLKQSDIDFRRNILANIRQERIAASQLAWNEQSDIATTSGAAGALANVQMTFSEPLTYQYQTMARQEKINQHYAQAQQYINKYQSQAKTAANWGKAIGMAGRIVGSAIGGPVGYAVGSLAGSAITYGLGGDRHAIQGAANEGINVATFGMIETPFNTQSSTGISGQNYLNRSMSQYYGTSYTPIEKQNTLQINTDKKTMANVSQGVLQLKQWASNLKFSSAPIESGGTSSISYSRGQM